MSLYAEYSQTFFYASGAVDNTFTGSLRYTGDSDFISTKHKGHGLGTQSVKIITEKYHGVCRLESRDGMFFASVMCQRE
ncbi:GHKL domain-containing protein [[Ruminococcus] lactaris]|uniref:GHKL domain-containing protein n=1 Tax=[Ruminococcus] lactaris TaxID=46228 RepID=UPI0030288B48|nr:GHKL domain-containing protein [[Ruminococcus] lactaris]